MVYSENKTEVPSVLAAGIVFMNDNTQSWAKLSEAERSWAKLSEAERILTFTKSHLTLQGPTKGQYIPPW